MTWQQKDKCCGEYRSSRVLFVGFGCVVWKWLLLGAAGGAPAPQLSERLRHYLRRTPENLNIFQTNWIVLILAMLYWSTISQYVLILTYKPITAHN